MQKIMFNDRIKLTAAVLEGQKTMTRRIATTEKIECPNIGWGIEGKERGKRVLCSCNEILAMSRYAKGEIVAIAQPYKEVCYSPSVQETVENKLGMSAEDSAGWNNKMFVKADLMPHHIKIVNVKVERLQDCSDDDILKEGVQFCANCSRYTILDCDEKHCFETPREAFAALIDKVSGKGTWERNPYCFCYTFKLID